MGKILGICGCTCSGKTSLSRSLIEAINTKHGYRTHHFLQDDFFLTKDKVDVIPHATDAEIIFYDYDSPSSVSLLESLKQTALEHDLVIVEGNLLTLLPEVCQVVDRLVFLTLDQETCRERRYRRTDYDPPDLPGYFDQVVWPSYEKTLQKTRDFEGKITLVHGNDPKLQHNTLIEIMDCLSNYVRLQQEPIDESSVIQRVKSSKSGAVSVFLGTTRDNFDGKQVVQLEYEAYEPMAYTELYRICKDIRREFPQVEKIAIVHRLGDCPVGETSVAIACSSPHRAEAMHATERIIDELKAVVPIWKKEIYAEGDGVWKTNKESAVSGPVFTENKEE